MGSFIEEMTDESRLDVECKAYKEKPTIYVEGLDDVVFWSELLKNNNIQIHCVSRSERTKGSRGKGALKKLTPFTSKYLILAKDSDIDYICPNHNNEAISFNECNHLLQTYFYSKESISLQPIVVDECLSKTKIDGIEIISNYKKYIESYSELIYDCLVKFLFLKNERKCPLNMKRFHSLIKPDNPILDGDFDLIDINAIKIESNIKNISPVLDSAICEIEGHKEKLKSFLADIKAKGLTSLSSYNYINGHNLENDVVSAFVSSCEKTLIEKLMNKTRDEFPEEGKLEEKHLSQMKERENEIIKIITRCHSFKTRVADCEKKFTHSVVNRINNELNKFLTGV